MSLALVERRTINNVLVSGYYGDNEPWFTRTQIGEALEYADPQNAITIIHRKHKNRLDLFSRWCQFDTPSGIQEGYVYNPKGVLEICRWSRQPKADMVMDKLYDMALSIRDKGRDLAMTDNDILRKLADRCVENPSLLERVNRKHIQSIANLNIKEEKDEARVIINEYKRKSKALTDYYNKHLGEEGFQEQHLMLANEIQTLLNEKCPHLEVLGMKVIRLKVKDKLPC